VLKRHDRRQPCCSTLEPRVAGVFPIGNEDRRLFDSEVQVQFNPAVLGRYFAPAVVFAELIK